MKYSKKHLSRVVNGDIEPVDRGGAPEKMRLDHFLLTEYPEYNRASLQTLIRNGNVLIDGVKVPKPNYQITGSERIELIPPKDIQIDLPVIYEDENVVVVDKPAGVLSMSKGELNLEPTVGDFVGGAENLVHRLDRLTSGVMIAAKNLETKGMLQKQFQERRAHKTYFAVVKGHPKHMEAVIDLPIARNLKKHTEFLVDAKGREAITQYKVLKQNERYSLLELKPTTGRTHQLRVHLAYIGTPILGDPVYDPHHKKSEDKMYLHAAALEITIPGEPNNERKIFESPVPTEFYDVF